MVIAEMLGDELVLGADVVVKGDFGESRDELCVGWGGGFTVAEERGDDDEILRDV